MDSGQGFYSEEKAKEKECHAAGLHSNPNEIRMIEDGRGWTRVA